jgi:hypothetical protein
MARIMSVLFLALLLATAGASVALAQAGGCQPTLTQPCAKPQKPNADQSSQRPTAAKPDDKDEPIDHSKRIKIDKDTDFNFGLGGLGVGRKF